MSILYASLQWYCMSKKNCLYSYSEYCSPPLETSKREANFSKILFAFYLYKIEFCIQPV